MSNDNRAVNGHALESLLVELARICVTASGLRMGFEPLSDEDRAAGAEPLTAGQINERLETISRVATVIAVTHLKAEPEEWYAAIDKVDN
jgi:hypothetical protein